MRIAREAFPFLIPALALTLLAGWFSIWAALPLLLVTLFIAWFFRDPDRTSPSEPGLLTSPADGRILRADATRITVFMNVFNVHICRAPDAGEVVKMDHIDGKFLAAFKEEALTQNERVEIDMTGSAGPFKVVLVAGLIARRIVPWITQGERLVRGGKLGLIRFGSRVDLYLPTGYKPSVVVGERVCAGETVLARAAHEEARDREATEHAESR